MSERSFALGCVALALAFGLVVPEPGKAPGRAAAPAMAISEPATQPVQEKGIDPIEVEPFAVHHAAPAKRDATPAVFWAARGSP